MLPLMLLLMLEWWLGVSLGGRRRGGEEKVDKTIYKAMNRGAGAQ